MNMSHKRQDLAQAATLQTASNDLIKLIRKLRWIGMDDEAERLTHELAQRQGAADDSVVAASGETD